MSTNFHNDTLTSQLILDKVYRLFCNIALDTLSMAQIARMCHVSEEMLTKNFGSKEELYQAAFHHALRRQPLMKVKPERHTNDQWLSELIEGYLADAHISGQQPGCPLAFLASHNSSEDAVVRETYASAFLASVRWLSQFISPVEGDTKLQAHSLLTTLIGAVNIARSFDNVESRQEYLLHCQSDLSRRLKLPPLLKA